MKTPPYRLFTTFQPVGQKTPPYRLFRTLQTNSNNLELLDAHVRVFDFNLSYTHDNRHSPTINSGIEGVTVGHIPEYDVVVRVGLTRTRVRRSSQLS